jgi:hypothetical protein
LIWSDPVQNVSNREAYSRDLISGGGANECLIRKLLSGVQPKGSLIIGLAGVRGGWIGCFPRAGPIGARTSESLRAGWKSLAAVPTHVRVRVRGHQQYVAGFFHRRKLRGELFAPHHSKRGFRMVKILLT